MTPMPDATNGGLFSKLKFQTKRIAAVLLAQLCIASVAFAQAGEISGHITDAETQLSLSGVEIRVSGTSISTFTDRFGDFRLAAVPAGPQQLEFAYVGYDTFSQSVEVKDGSPSRIETSFGKRGEVVQLQRYVISGAAVGTARALNQQRSSETLSTFVAADEIGRFPDQNAAESMQRIPGVSLYRDQGEGRFIVLRGLNYAYGNVTLEGMKLASPEIGDRGVALDVIPADALASVEVLKVPTPDKDGEGLGGSVDMRTKSAFDHTGLHLGLTTQGQYSKLSGKFSGKINGVFSNVFADGQIGLLIAPTWQKRKFGSYNYEVDDGWTREVETSTGDVSLAHDFLQDIAFRDYEIERTRYGVSSALEFKPDADTLLYLRGTYNRFTDEESRHVSFIPFIQGLEGRNFSNLSSFNESSATVAEVRRYSRMLRMREKDQNLKALVAGVKKTLGSLKLDGAVSWSKAHEEKPQEVEVSFRRSNRDGTFRYTFTDAYSINVAQLAGASISDPASYNQLDELTINSESGSETEKGIALNARYDLSAAVPVYVKAGGVVRRKTKDSEAQLTEYAAPSSFTFASVAGSVSDYPYGLAVPQINPEAMRRVFLGNLSSFTGTLEPEDSNYDDWNSKESVTAAYAMGGVTFGRTHLVAGSRFERTQFTTTGKELEFDAGGDFTGTHAISGSRTYSNWLPGLHLRQDIGRNLVLRASWSNSFSRPSFGDSAYRRNINREDQEITVGNPNLEQLTSRNWDVSAEYYLPSLGIVSVAAFRKDVKNFSFETKVEEDPAFSGYEVTSFRNGSEGSINGVEFGYQQQLSKLPAPFDGLGLMANLTLTNSEATYRGLFAEDMPFVGQSDRVGNVALTYEKYGFFTRLALNFRSERLREDEAVEDRLWVDDFAQLDLTASYKINKNFEVYAEFLNLTNEPFCVYQKTQEGTTRFIQFEEYDWSANFGIRWKL